MSDDSVDYDLKVLSDLIPDYSPYSEMAMADCNANVYIPHRDQASLPFDEELNDGALNAECKNEPAAFSENVAVLPEVSEIRSREVEETLLSDDSEDNYLSSDYSDSLHSSESESSHSYDSLPDLPFFRLKMLKVKCLDSMECLVRKCEDSGLKFNASSRIAVVQKINHDLCNVVSNESLQDVRVACLSTVETLMQICKKENLKYPIKLCLSLEVDMIFAHRVISGKTVYYIKWKKLSSEYNSWVPSSCLRDYHDIIQYYHAMRRHNTIPDRKLLSCFVKDLISRKPTDILTLTKMCALISGKSEAHVRKSKLTVFQMKATVRKALHMRHIKQYAMHNNLFKIMQFGEARKRALLNLIEWEEEINSYKESAYIKVENNVDLETAPDKFLFIRDYINTAVDIPEEPVTFCECQNCFYQQDTCCPHNSEGHFAYDKHRRLILEPGYPIFECNSKCSCDHNCINRVVQHGAQIKVCIFRTFNDCGWGLKTLENIKKGQFVLEYLGEIITSEVAEARGHIYDYVGRSYLFDLDYGVDNTDSCYTIDAGHIGNESHFINHSCDPNLHVFAVWINQPDPRLPRLAFFAKRDIAAGEELTFDYKMEQRGHFNPSSPRREDNKRVLCKCKSKNCRKYLF